MSYQTKIKTMEAAPWSVASGKKYVTFHIPAGGNIEIANSYLEFSGSVNMGTLVTYPYGYTGSLRFGYIDHTDSYNYSSGASVVVRHAWLESEALGNIESKRYANVINEDLAHMQKPLASVRSQNYSGGDNFHVVDNDFVWRLQLSDLLELPKDEPLIDLDYTGALKLTLELEVVNPNAVICKYVSTPSANVGCNNIASAEENVSQLTIPGSTILETTLHLNQVYKIVWEDSIGTEEESQHTILNFEESGGDVIITIDPPLSNAAGEDLENIVISALPLDPHSSGVDSLEITDVELVLYKPFGKLNKKGLMFREILVDAVNQPAVQHFRQVFQVEPNVELVHCIGVKENQFVALADNFNSFRNQINGFDTVDNREVLRDSGLYQDKIIMQYPRVRNMNLYQRYCIVERMPLNGNSNVLQVVLNHTGVPSVDRSFYLFKHQLKQL